MTKNKPVLDLDQIETTTVKTSFSDCFEIIPGDHPGMEVDRLEGSLECSTCVAIFNSIRPKVCLDIGANIGTHALIFAKHCEQVYAFEPNPYIYPILQRNIGNSKTRVMAFQFGLSDTAADLNLHVDRSYNTGSSSLIAENLTPQALETSQPVAVKVEVGDEILAKLRVEHVDFIKIDTEGYEADVLLGLKQCIMRDKPVIALEWNSDFTRSKFEEHDIFKTLFPDYLCFGAGRFWNKCLYSTAISKLKRGIAKNMLKIVPPPALQKFMRSGEYNVVFLIPERFKHLVYNFSFLPDGYIPVVGAVDQTV